MKSKYKNILGLVFSFLFFWNQNIISQTDSTKLEFNQIEVVKSFDLKLKGAEPIAVNPLLPVQDVSPLVYSYKITPVSVNINFPNPEIRALAMQPDDPYEPYNGFIKAGYGNRKSPYLEASYNRVRKDVYHWGAYGKYEHANDTENVLNQKFTNINLDAFGSYVWKNNVRLDGLFENAYKNRILWNENDSKDSLFTIRKTNFVRVNMTLANIDLAKYDLNYKISAGMYNLRVSDQNAFENQVFIEGYVEKHRSEKLSFVWPLRLETTFMKSENWNSLFNLHTSPHVLLRFGKFRSLLGASALVSNSNSSIFPKIDISYPVLSNSVQVFIGSDQRVYANSVANLNTENPFFNTSLPDLVNSVTKDIYLGVKGEFAHISYQVNMGYKFIHDMSFFILDSVDVKRHSIVFDQVKAPYLSGNLEYRISPTLKVGGWITQNLLRTDTLVNPFHMPGLSLSSYVKAAFFDNSLFLNGQFSMLGSYHYLNLAGDQKTENPMFDLMASVEYFPLEKLGIYLKGSNLLNQKYQRWQGYRNFEIQVSGGIFFKF